MKDGKMAESQDSQLAKNPHSTQNAHFWQRKSARLCKRHLILESRVWRYNDHCGSKRRKIAAVALFASVLAIASLAQTTGQTRTLEDAAASAFEGAMAAEGGPHLKRIEKKHVYDFCATDARRWGDGILGYQRVSFTNENELSSKLLTLVRQWKTMGSQNPIFDPSDFPKLRRYAVANCGAVHGQTKVVVAVYRSGWDTYWANWANLLGK